MVFLRNEGCRVACIRSGHTGGERWKKSCRCFDVIEENYETFIHNQIDWIPFAEPKKPNIETGE